MPPSKLQYKAFNWLQNIFLESLRSELPRSFKSSTCASCTLTQSGLNPVGVSAPLWFRMQLGINDLDAGVWEYFDAVFLGI